MQSDFIFIENIKSFYSNKHTSIVISSEENAFVRLPALANASVHSLPFFLIVIYIAIRKFIRSSLSVSFESHNSYNITGLKQIEASESREFLFHPRNFVM